MFMAANQHSPFIAFVLGQNVVHMVLFWAQSSIFAAIDLLQPACLMAYKVQDANMPLDRARFWNAVRRVLFNQVVVNTLLAMAVFPLFRWRGTSFDLPLPTFHRMLGELVVFVLAEEVGFYYSHRWEDGDGARWRAEARVLTWRVRARVAGCSTCRGCTSASTRSTTSGRRPSVRVRIAVPPHATLPPQAAMPTCPHAATPRARQASPASTRTLWSTCCPT